MIGTAILGSVVIILVVEILRTIRLVHISAEEIDELRERVVNLEKLLKM